MNKQVDCPARRMKEANYLPRQTNGTIKLKFTPGTISYWVTYCFRETEQIIYRVLIVVFQRHTNYIMENNLT